MTAPAKPSLSRPILTVLLLGGLRLVGPTMLVAPSPYTLILGALFVRLLCRAARLRERLLASSRSTLANVNAPWSSRHCGSRLRRR